MPRLVNFVPCEKGIIDSQSGLPSAIGFIMGAKIRIEADEPIDPQGSIQMKWAIVSTWTREQDEEDKELEQRIQLILLNGFIAVDTTIDFSLKQITHHTVVSIEGFPIGQSGAASLKTDWRKKGDEEWIFAREFTIDIDVTAVPSSKVAPSEALSA